MIRTEDNQFVNPHEMAWEIRYTWFNAEVSLAEPYEIQAGEAEMKNIPIWKDIIQCDRECIRINKLNRYSLEEYETTVKFISCQIK